MREHVDFHLKCSFLAMKLGSDCQSHGRFVVSTFPVRWSSRIVSYFSRQLKALTSCDGNWKCANIQWFLIWRSFWVDGLIMARSSEVLQANSVEGRWCQSFWDMKSSWMNYNTTSSPRCHHSRSLTMVCKLSPYFKFKLYIYILYIACFLLQFSQKNWETFCFGQDMLGSEACKLCGISLRPLSGCTAWCLKP